MTEREIKLRLKTLYLQLEIIDEYEAEFIEKEGKRGVAERRDIILDEINELKRLLKKK